MPSAPAAGIGSMLSSWSSSLSISLCRGAGFLKRSPNLANASAGANGADSSIGEVLRTDATR